MTRRRRFVFLTSCPDAWGGSEELWSGAARRLHQRGHSVVACRCEPWPQGRLHSRWVNLRGAGISVGSFGATRFARLLPDLVQLAFPLFLRPAWRLRNLLLAVRLRLLAPELVVISQGQAYDAMHPICLPEICRMAGVPYVLVCQKASELQWPPDGLREIFRQCYLAATAVFFVSNHNQLTVERQLAINLTHAEIIRNPFLVPSNELLPWPEQSDGLFRFACVGRLWPLEKGQDLLLNVLSKERWRKRPIEVNFFGQGPMALGLVEMAQFLGLTNVRFSGVAPPIDIWRTHHALILASRSEGLPLVQVEAMMCGRPVIVTEAGGTSEIMCDGEHGFLAKAAIEADIDSVLERAWHRRDEWASIGEAAARQIRHLYSGDPCIEFADRLIQLS